MIVARVWGRQLQDLRSCDIRRIKVSGHAGAGEYGRDLVCAAVSTLATNFINSAETLCEVDLQPQVGSGLLDVTVTQQAVIQWLARSFVTGLSGLAQDHSKYVRLVLEEE